MADCTSRESINYDEYLDAGIPDTLLEGLGFYASSGDAEASSETDEIPDERPVPEIEEERHSHTAVSSATTGLSDVLPIACRRGRPPKSPKYVHEHSIKATSAPITVSHVPQTPSADGAQLSSSTPTGDQASKTIIKGNIVYKRTATGEVIASVIKNGPKPEGSVSVAASTSRGRPSFESRTTASLGVAGETSVPADCPVNENNVERVLDESITATQSMRRTLVSLKDDLRRMGGGPAVSATLKPIHLQHRINIAYKVACAFAEYRSTISAISSARSASSTVTSSPVVTCQTIKSSEVPSIATSIPPVTGVPAVTPVPVSIFRSVPATSLSQVSTAVARTQPQQKQLQQKTGRPVAKTVLKQSSTDLTNVVSNDLWMSCEPDL